MRVDVVICVRYRTHMARRIITRELYDMLLTAYRESPGNASNAARYAGVGRRFARRAWDTGWEKHPWARPIMDVITDEQSESRAMRGAERLAEYRDAAKMRDMARTDAIEQRAAESRTLKMARGASMALLNATLNALRAAQPLSERMAEMNTDDVDPKTVIQLVERVARLTGTATQTAHAVMRMERLHMGEPETIVGVDLGSLSDDDLRRELREISTMLDAGGGDDVLDVDAITVQPYHDTD